MDIQLRPLQRQSVRNSSKTPVHTSGVYSFSQIHSTTIHMKQVGLISQQSQAES